MAQQPQRSLKEEFARYVDDEIENYKDSISRDAILAIAEDAVRSLDKQKQIEITEIVLCAEVDRIVARRLALPTYAVWRRRRNRLRERYRSPEHWGLRPDGFLVREVRAVADGHVLVAGAMEEGPALYLAAHGSAVTAIDHAADAIERVMTAAQAAGLTERVRGCVSDVGHWIPDVPLTAVICSATAFDTLSNRERAHAIAQLQRATLAGGVHLMRTPNASTRSATLDELRQRYDDGWVISEERSETGVASILARKQVA